MRIPSTMAALLVASAIVFAVGVAIERSQGHTEGASTTEGPGEEGEGAHSEAGEEGEHAEVERLALAVGEGALEGDGALEAAPSGLPKV